MGGGDLAAEGPLDLEDSEVSLEEVGLEQRPQSPTSPSSLNGEEDEEEEDEEEEEGSSEAAAGSAGAHMKGTQWDSLLGKCRVRTAVLARLVQGLLEIYQQCSAQLSPRSIQSMLDILTALQRRARESNADDAVRRALSAALSSRRVPKEQSLADPPLLRVEVDATSAEINMLALLTTRTDPLAAEVRQTCGAEGRMVRACCTYLDRFDALYKPRPAPEASAGAAAAAAAREGKRGKRAAAAAAAAASVSGEESRSHAQLVVSVLNSIGFLEPPVFQRHVREFYPRMARLIGCPGSDWEVRKSLMTLFETHVGPIAMGQAAAPDTQPQ